MNRRFWKKEFKDRLAAREDELRWLYMELYRNDGQAYDYFVSMLYKAYSSRPEALKALDREREQKPGWYTGRGIVGMLMYADAFAGTLSGVREKLSYVEECGVNYLHLMPLLESPEGRSDGGYSVSDFRKVQPALGTMEDLSALTADCHERGIAVCLDFVMNHTSEDHAWARRARAGEKEFQDRYFFFDNWDVPDLYEKTVPQVFPTTAPGNFTWCEEAGKVVMTTFYPYQWDLNYANPTVFNDMTDNMLNLCNHGVDVIRLDAVPYIWKALGTNCRNLPEVHTLVRMLRLACETVCPGTLLLGEVVMEPDKVVPYFGTIEKPECHMLYNVTTMASVWHTAASRDVRLLRHQLEAVFRLPGKYTFLNYLRCHDDIGWGLDYPFLQQFGQQEVPHKKYLNDYLTGRWPGSHARGELYNDDERLGDARLCGTTASLCGIESCRKTGDAAGLEAAVRLDLTLHALMFSLSGLPVLYSGDEVAQENDYSYHDDPKKAEDSRYLHRGRFDWEKAEKRHLEGTPENIIFHTLKKLEALRAELLSFGREAEISLLPEEDASVLGIRRRAGGEELYMFFNFGMGETFVSLPGGKKARFEDALTGEKAQGGKRALPGQGFAWYLKRDGAA